MKNIILGLILLVSTAGFLAAETDYQEIIKSLNDMQNFDEMDLSFKWTVVSQKPGEDKSVMKLQIYRRDIEEKFLYLFLKPEVDKGQGFLMSGDNAWAYDPSSRKFSHFSLKENIGDSDAKNEDIDGYDYVEDYDITETEDGKLGKIATHIITLEAKTDEVATPKIKVWIRKDNNLILKQEDYSLSGRLVRTMLFPKWTTVAGRYLPSKQLFIDNLKEGEKTQMTISDLSNAQIPDETFTKNYLEQINNK